MAASLVITGMHRSGTSLVASAVQRAGVDIGSELNPPARGNRRGHFEDIGFLRFHEGFMERRGVSLFSPAMDWVPRATQEEEAEARELVARRAGRPLWGFKDPRTSLFLDFWDPLLPAPFYLFLFRHPVEVILSLLRRELDPDVIHDPWNAVQAWRIYNSRLLDFRLAHPERCALWPLSGVAGNLEAALAALGERLGVRLATAGLNDLFQAEELRLGLARTDLDWPAVLPEALGLHQRLLAAADRPSVDRTAPRERTRETEELLVWQTLRAGAEIRRIAVGWKRVEETRGWRLLQGYWSLSRRLRSAPRRTAFRLRHLGGPAGPPRPEEVLVGCVVENDPKSLARARRLALSLRWFGGALAGSKLMVCAVEGIDARAREALEECGAELRIVPRFDPRNPFANKLQFFPEAETTDAGLFLLLDTDTVIVRDPLPFLDRGVFQAKIADVPSVSHAGLELVFQHFGLELPTRRYVTTFTGTRTILYCNSGVLAVPARLACELVPIWRDYNSRILDVRHLLGAGSKHCNQASLSLALAACPVPFRVAPVELNFPLNQTVYKPSPAVLAADPAILHYHDRVDEAGRILPVPYPKAQACIEAFNQRLNATANNG
ncbi:MAG TPA: hypothetical protein VGS07_21060 [Thermoanaerobaculia bacterium]|jgi:hypothetical protein|nr:hypothetical protein [Thermoanaerobaculia bacterium]